MSPSSTPYMLPGETADQALTRLIAEQVQQRAAAAAGASSQGSMQQPMELLWPSGYSPVPPGLSQLAVQVPMQTQSVPQWQTSFGPPSSSTLLLGDPLRPRDDGQTHSALMEDAFERVRREDQERHRAEIAALQARLQMLETMVLRQQAPSPILPNVS